jgi:Cd2+/Zn2+-exporting ATPase
MGESDHDHDHAGHDHDHAGHDHDVPSDQPAAAG